MTKKVTPIRKILPKTGVLAAPRRALVLKAGDMEIALAITAEPRPLRADSEATPPQSRSKALAVIQPIRG